MHYGYEFSLYILHNYPMHNWKKWRRQPKTQVKKTKKKYTKIVVNMSCEDFRAIQNRIQPNNSYSPSSV